MRAGACVGNVFERVERESNRKRAVGEGEACAVGDHETPRVFAFDVDDDGLPVGQERFHETGPAADVDTGRPSGTSSRATRSAATW